MGNCICMNVKKVSSTEWGGEDWGSVLSPPEKKQPENIPRREKTAVKVKITKKQLEELLKGDHENSLNQVLTQLLSMNPQTTSSWMPALHSIPESEEY